MIRSVTLINFNPGTTNEQAQAARDAYLRLPELIPELKNIEVGIDLGLFDGSADLVVIADFENQQDFGVYSTHKAQEEVIFPVCGPLMANYTTLQYEA